MWRETADGAFVMSTEKSLLTAAVMAIGLAIGVPAQASTYNFSYSDGIVSASGTLTTGAADTGLNGPGFDITGITGNVTDTLGTSTITGLLGSGVCCQAPADNNIFYPSGTPFLDRAGLGFSGGNGEEVNIYYITNYFALVSTDNNLTSSGSGPGSFTADATPLPAALPLFASGLGALGLLGWRRKRKAAAFAA
jgi:hypothetical protein